MRVFRICAALLVLAMIEVASLPARAQSFATYEDCEALSDSDFRTAIDDLTRKTLQDELLSADYRQIVDAHWQRVHMDALIDRLVDRAIADAHDRNGYLKRLIASYHPGIAEEIAESVVARVFDDPAFAERYTQLSEALADQLEEQIAQATMNARGSASRCLRAFLETNYATSVADAVGHFVIDQNIDLDPELNVSHSIIDFRATLAGAATLIMRRTLQQIVLRAVRRVAGSIAARISSAAVPVVGWALIAYDLFYGPESVLNDIHDELKSEETKAGMRQRIADSLATSIENEVEDASRLAADTLNAEWVAFRSRYRQILDLTQRETTFRNYIETVPADEFDAVAETADLITKYEQTAGLLRRAEDGSLDDVRQLSEAGRTLASQSGDIDLALRWTELAGKSLPKVVDLRIHDHFNPDDMAETELSRLIALDNNRTVSRLALLSGPSRAAVLEQSTEHVQDIARTLESEDLNQFGTYLQALDDEGDRTLTRLVLDEPRDFARISEDAMRSAVLASGDPSQAMRVATRNGLTSQLSHLMEDIGHLTSGRISFGVYWSIHALASIVILLMLGIILSYILRGILPARRRNQR